MVQITKNNQNMSPFWDRGLLPSEAVRAAQLSLLKRMSLAGFFGFTFARVDQIHKKEKVLLNVMNLYFSMPKFLGMSKM